MSKRKWVAAYTRPRYEKKVDKALKEKDIPCYLPLIKTLRQWSDRKKWVEMPLFSSYIFVNALESDYLEVLKIPGVIRIVRFEGKVIEIPEKEIENIKWILSTDIQTEPFEEQIPTGSKVMITKGPLNGLMAEMVHYNNKNRIIIRIEQLERSLEIQIPRSHVKLI